MIALDTNIFIYWLERNPEFYIKSADIIKKVHSEVEPACCSVLVLSELYHGNAQAIDAVSNLPGLSIYEVTRDIAELAGKLRHRYSIKVIDSIHLASAMASSAKEFITNDQQLAALIVPDLQVRLLSAL